VEIVESSSFTKYVRDYFTDDEYREFQNFILASPEFGDLIQGTGGFRKVRWSDPTRQKGKRGGVRIIYYFFDSDHQIWLISIYDKNEMADLKPAEKKQLKEAIESEKRIRLIKKVTPIKKGKKK